MSRPAFIDDAVRRALSEEYPSDGVTAHLKTLLCEGYRADITDSLLDILDLSTSADEKGSVLEILYFVHGVGPAIFFDPQFRDPRPEDAGGKERIRRDQLDRLCRLALKETLPEVWDSYASTLDCILGLNKPSVLALDNAKCFCERAIAKGRQYAKQRCEQMMRSLNM
jgi:hypothetical protein